MATHLVPEDSIFIHKPSRDCVCKPRVILVPKKGRPMEKHRAIIHTA